MDLSITRRHLFQAGAGLAVSGALGETAVAAESAKNVYEALGVKRASSTPPAPSPSLGGSVMPPEVVAAWAEASKHFVDLVELHDKVGERIAKLIGVEAALVTTGAAGALLLGTAAAVTRGDRKLIAPAARHDRDAERGPHPEGAPQLLRQPAHRRRCEADRRRDRRPTSAKAVSERTALMFFMNNADGRRARSVARSGSSWPASTRSRRCIDAAADVPPGRRASRSTPSMGFDLVAVQRRQGDARPERHRACCSAART